MNGVMIDPNEYESIRQERLCEFLNMSSQANVNKVWAHYMIWMCRWARDNDTDSGIFFDCSVRRIGSWANWPNPERFGQALVHANYIFDLKDKYPDEVLKGREGFVYYGRLDVSWGAVHRFRKNKKDLAYFIADPERRYKALRLVKCDCCGNCINPCLVSSQDDSQGGSQGDSRGGHPGSSPGGPSSSSPSPPFTSTSNVKKENTFQRNKKNVENTGNEPSEEMRLAVREHMYENPHQALKILDGTDVADITWKAICAKDLSFVQTLLAELTDTTQAWTTVRNPAAVVTARAKERLTNERTHPLGDELEGRELKVING